MSHHDTKKNDNVEEITIEKIPFSFAKKNNIVLEYHNNVAYLYFNAYPKVQVISEIIRFIQNEIHLVQVSKIKLSEALSRCYSENKNDAYKNDFTIGDDIDLSNLAEAVPDTEDLLEQVDDAPVIKLINALLTQAIREGASDIHIETFEQYLIVRIRIDGILREILKLDKSLSSLLVSRIKVMAKLDIAEKRIPQDGRISLKIAGKEVDVRVSTLPSNNSERVVLRLLEKNNCQIQLDELGMSKQHKKQITNLLHSPHGIILVTGPTGSGKTTSLYTGLSTLNNQDRNILTIEDPIEYNLEGIGQTQVNPKAEMTFSRGLRAILRQDPDVVMIGEIRDLETAEIAIQASLTGHLVLSTLHTNTAVGALTRLQDMGIKSFLLASSLIGVISQRLVRVLCLHCKEKTIMNKSECEYFGIDDKGKSTVYTSKGCKKCNYIGYKGRTGIYEILIIDETVKKMVHDNENEQKITQYIRKHYPSILESGLSKVLEGTTSTEEILRVTHKGQM